ncbi:MAG: hypothetical protein ACR2GM_03485, partial [Nocardioidaceae bacterium]
MQNVVTDPRGASGGLCEIARRIRASTGSFFDIGQVEPPQLAADHPGSVTTKTTRSVTDVLM